jgi:hypothetical protein
MMPRSEDHEARMPSSFHFSMQSWWLLAAGGVVLLVILALCARLILSTPRSRSEHRFPAIGRADQRNLERDISTLLYELSDLAGQVGRQLDSRANRLEELIRAADERIEQLRSSPIAPTAAPRQPASDEPGSDPRDLEIYHLHDQGLDPREIAQRLARPAGEIELILALRPRHSHRVA